MLFRMNYVLIFVLCLIYLQISMSYYYLFKIQNLFYSNYVLLEYINIPLIVAFIAVHWLTLLNFLSLSTVSLNAITFTLKFIVIIALLVFVRGGIPRYRYDFLTKIGWIKFLSLVLLIFLFTWGSFIIF